MSEDVTAPESFVEMQQRQAEHLGRLQLGSIVIYRDVVKFQVVDETGTPVLRIDLPTHDLTLAENQALWNLSVVLSKPVAEAIREEATAAFSNFVMLSAALPPDVSGRERHSDA